MSRTDFPSRRQRLKKALDRSDKCFGDFSPPSPLTLEGPTPAAPFGSSASLEWERIQLRVEPGEIGRLVLLIAKPADSAFAEPRPAVIIVHQTGSAKESVAEHLERYAEKGFISVAFDVRYHGERALPNAGLPEPLKVSSLGPELNKALKGFSGQRLSVYYDALVKAWKTGEEKPFLYDTVSDAYRVIDYLRTRKDVERYSIGATGISLGGMITWLLAASDDRIAAVAPAIGVQSFRYAVENNSWEPRVSSILPPFEQAAKDLGKGEVDSEVVRAVWTKILPGMIDGEFDAEFSLPCIAPRPLLVLSGELDGRCCLEGVKEAMKHASTEYEAQGASKCVSHFVDMGVGHVMTDNMWSAIDPFLEEALLQDSGKHQPTPSKKARL